MSLVLFSGGCDSTLVLHNLLKENLKDYSKPIISLAVNHCQVSANKQNKRARNLFIAEMEKRELNSYWQHCEIDISSNMNATVGGSFSLSQPIIWSMLSMLYVKNNDTIYFGYHKSDDFWMHKEAFENAIKNICRINDKNVNIEYPLKDYYKADIIKTLKTRGLYDMCWYCENEKYIDSTLDEYTPCGNCTPCITHRTALWQIETFYSNNTETKIGNDIQITDYVFV